MRPVDGMAACGVATLLLLLAAPLVSAPDPRQWWRASVVFHVNVRLFRDSDGDGVGDLRGVTENLDFLAHLGVDVIWLSPIFSSASEYYVGHKISNFTDIDAVFGDMASFQTLMEAATLLGIKVLLELVPNHTSDSHEWFELSAQREEPYTDYYVWDDGSDANDEDDREPPNNWVSVTGGSAWTWHEERRQFFLHQFGDMQPDLNYRSKDVRAEMEEVLTFWLRQGVSGFVLSSVSHMYESSDLQDEPLRSTGKDWEYSLLVHNNTLDLPETYHQVRQWHRLMDEYGSGDNFTRFLVVESHSSLQNVLSYYGSEDMPVADMPLNFRFLSSLHLNNTAKEMETAISDWLLHVPNGSVANWVVGSNTLNDMVTHFSAHEVDALNAMLQILPGAAVVYNGDPTSETAWEEAAVAAEYSAGDEAYPTPNWDPPFSSAATGLSENRTSLLEPNSSHEDGKQVNQELEDVHSRLLKQTVLKRSIPTLQFGDFQVSAITMEVLLLVRTLDGWDTYAAVINFGDSSATLNISTILHNVATVTVHTSSSNSRLTEGEKILSSIVILPPHASALLRLSYIPLENTESYAGMSDSQTELFQDDLDNSTVMNDKMTESEFLILENSTEIPTTEMPEITDTTTEQEGDKMAKTTTTVKPEYQTETSTREPDNCTEISEVVHDSTEMYTDNEAIENSTEISTITNRRNFGQYPTDPVDKVAAPVSPSDKANQKTEPPTSTNATGKVGERHNSRLLLISSLILLSAGLLQ